MRRKTGAERKKRPYSQKASAWMNVLAAVAGAVIAGALSFSSPSLALTAGGFALFSLILLMDQKRRGFWEKEIGFKINQLYKAHELLAENVEGKIYALKKDVKANTAKIERAEKIQTFKKTKKPEKQFANAAGSQALKFSPPPAEPVRRDPPPAPHPAPAPMIANDMADVDSDYSDLVVKELLHNAVKSKEVELFVQPVQRLPQRRTQFYELYARIRAHKGAYISAGRYMELARAEDLNGDIDTLMLVECLNVIRRSSYVQRATPFFVNITGKTLRNKAFMQRLLDFLSRHRNLAPRLIFEMSQSDYIELSAPVRQVIRGLGTLGCAFSIDHVKDLEALDANDMRRHKVRYAKLDAPLLREKIENDRGLKRLQQLKARMESNGIIWVAEKLEDEGDVAALAPLDLSLGQGYLLGKPGPRGAYARRDAA